MADICFYAQFVAAKVGLDGIAVTWDIEQITRSTGARAALVTGGATNIIVGRNGLYGYRLTGADLTLYDYVATAITADGTVDQQELAAMWTFWSLQWHDVLTAALTAVGSIGALFVNTLDAAISTRGTAKAGDAMALTAGERTTTAGVFLSQLLEGVHTVGDGLRIMLAALAGKSNGGGTSTNNFRDVADGKNRIAATVDNDGNRTALTLDGTV
jgi:hypothetical protein